MPGPRTGSRLRATRRDSPRGRRMLVRWACGLGIGPVVVVVVPRAPGRQAAHVARFVVIRGELVLGEVARPRPSPLPRRCRSRRGCGPRRRKAPMAPPMLALPQDCADPDVGRPLLGRDPVVLARPHRELAQPVALGELAQTAEVRARAPPGRRSPAASSSARGRRDTPRAASAAPPASTPDFVGSPERLTSTSAGIVSLRAADSEASEWQSSQSSLTSGALRLCRWPMKCQRKASP